jgi:hypothetical protein
VPGQRCLPRLVTPYVFVCTLIWLSKCFLAPYSSHLIKQAKLSLSIPHRLDASSFSCLARYRCPSSSTKLALLLVSPSYIYARVTRQNSPQHNFRSLAFALVLIVPHFNLIMIIDTLTYFVILHKNFMQLYSS